MIPQSTLDSIIYDFLQLFSKSIERQSSEIRKFLLQQEVPSNTIQKVESILKNNCCIEGLKMLNTSKKRESFLANNFAIVQGSFLNMHQNPLFFAFLKISCFFHICTFFSLFFASFTEIFCLCKFVELLRFYIKKWCQNAIILYIYKALLK